MLLIILACILRLAYSLYCIYLQKLFNSPIYYQNNYLIASKTNRNYPLEFLLENYYPFVFKSNVLTLYDLKYFATNFRDIA